jgi:dihydroorotate dehydrogenase subfamily 1
MEKYSRELLKTYQEDFRLSREAGLVPIPSLVGYSIEEWKDMAKSFEDIGAGALELNLGCPSEEKTIKGSMGGYTILQDEKKTYDVVRAVSESCSIPVMVKLTYHIKDVPAIAKICKEAGAKAVSAINTIRGIVGIDVNTGNLLSSDASGNGYITGMSGPIIRPFGLRTVIEIGQTTDIPVCAIGGIDGWKSAVEYIMVGAGLTQTCTAVMWHGFKLGKRMADGLVRFMKEKNYSTIEDFRGISIKRVVIEPVDHPWVKAAIDYEKCNFCQKCYVACRDAAFGAIELQDSKVIIHQNLCDGCGLCKVVCKKEAIDYISR